MVMGGCEDKDVMQICGYALLRLLGGRVPRPYSLPVMVGTVQCTSLIHSSQPAVCFPSTHAHPPSYLLPAADVHDA